MPETTLTPPTLVERIFNRVFGWLVAIGAAPASFYLLEVRGRKSGRVYSMPVDLLELDGRTYLVAPRGNTQWSRNARASGMVTLRRGRRRDEYSVIELDDGVKPKVLKAYLDAYSGQVQRFFPVPAGSPPEAFAPLAPAYPCFELRASPPR